MIEEKNILGVWKLVAGPHEEGEKIYLEFKPGNVLTHISETNGKKDIILLTFRIEDEYLVTDQPSSPRIEKTIMALEDDKLTLKFEGIPHVFNRALDK